MATTLAAQNTMNPAQTTVVPPKAFHPMSKRETFSLILHKHSMESTLQFKIEWKIHEKWSKRKRSHHLIAKISRDLLSCPGKKSQE